VLPSYSELCGSARSWRFHLIFQNRVERPRKTVNAFQEDNRKWSWFQILEMKACSTHAPALTSQYLGTHTEFGLFLLRIINCPLQGGALAGLWRGHELVEESSGGSVTLVISCSTSILTRAFKHGHWQTRVVFSLSVTRQHRNRHELLSHFDVVRLPHSQ
jgi:hypothetical protein